MIEENSGRTFRLVRSAAVSIGVVFFLFAFRPFGLTIDSVVDALALLGMAPLNFLIMLGIHVLPIRRQPWRTIVALGFLVVGNMTYLSVWSQSMHAFETGLSVVLVIGLTASVVSLWNRGRIPEQEFDARQSDIALDRRSIRLSGEGDQEILQLLPDELLFMKANGNYVDVYYRKDHSVAKSMFRSSLAGLAEQVPGEQMVQCHRSYFVNLAVARRIVRAKGRTQIEFDGGQRVPVSRMFGQAVRKAISG